MTMTPNTLTQIRNFAAPISIGAGAIGIVRHATPSHMTRIAGLAAGLAGADALANGDRATTSMLGSAMQTFGGFTLFAAKAPKTALAGGILTAGGATTNAIEKWLPQSSNKFVNPFVKAIVMGGAAGGAIGAMSKDLEDAAIGTVVGAFVGLCVGAVKGSMDM